MLPRTVLFVLLTTSLLPGPYFERPLAVMVGSASAETHDSSSLVSPQNSNDDKYSLRGSVVNSLTGTPPRCARAGLSQWTEFYAHRSGWKISVRQPSRWTEHHY